MSINRMLLHKISAHYSELSHFCHVVLVLIKTVEENQNHSQCTPEALLRKISNFYLPMIVSPLTRSEFLFVKAGIIFFIIVILH